MAKDQARTKVRRREKKNISSGVAHVNASFNNTMITITDVQGNSIAVDAAGENVTVDGARVIRADILAANGVIHAIDAVMIPPDVILLPADETAVNVTENSTG